MPTLYLTGSSGALASVIRSLYLEREWSVVGFDRTNDGFQHRDFEFIETDMLDVDSVAEAFSKANKMPRALIATVGGVKPWSTVEEIVPEDFDFVVRLNLHSAFYAVRAALPLMYVAGVGSIVTIGAETGLRPEPKKAAYVAAKAGVIAFTMSVAEEGKLRGVNANVIVPTVIHTKANESWGSPEDIAKWTPPESIAEAVFFLTSEPGKAINGAVIRMPNKM